MKHKGKLIREINHFGLSNLPLLHFAAANKKEKIVIALVKVHWLFYLWLLEFQLFNTWKFNLEVFDLQLFNLQLFQLQMLKL